ncbi:hypothetical protein Glove_177g100 [Diversispora epigaea]|uniref:Uncharacterized protein n=1 Tax=Diversispora epigaea TaxID=1348612 RepID=A0A397IRP5_9GLOM|nr:hypothetical protein Glove_177g100 [Diversispora epigaea]
MNNNNNSMDNSATASTTRKRGRLRKEKATLPIASTTSTSTSTSAPAPDAKKRGRPRKVQKVEVTDCQKITNIKNFIIKNHPSVANGSEEIADDSPESMKMAKKLWENVINYEKKYLA